MSAVPHILLLAGFFAVVLLAVVIVALVMWQRRSGTGPVAAPAGDAGDHQLADEYRRLSEQSVAAQARTDKRLEEITMQLGQVREQLDSVQRILKDVE
jgi:uncharacterized protein HemX